MNTLTPKTDTEKTIKNQGLSNTINDLGEALNENILYRKDPLSITDVNDLEQNLEKLNLKEKLQKKAKTFMIIVREIAQNVVANSLKDQGTLYIKENNKDGYISIKTSNYFDGGKENKEKLEESLDNINNSNRETIKAAYKNTLKDGKMKTGKIFSGAGLGILLAASKLKKMISGKIFNYKIKEEKDENNKTIYKFDLETKFPMPDMGMAA